MVERMRYLCRQKGTNFKKLEIELNLGNGSLAKTSTKTQCGRLKILADYFGVSMEYLMTGREYNAPAVPPETLLPAEYQRILEYYKRFNEIGRAKIESYMDGLVNNPAFVADAQGEKLA